MDYKTESRIMQPHKQWLCEHCGSILLMKSSVFCRIEEFGKPIEKDNGEIYYQKIYKRYHFLCAKQLPDLTKDEKELINYELKSDKNKEKDLKKQINRLLIRYEKQNLLTYLFVPTMMLNYRKKYFRMGKEGISNLLVFCPNGKTLFCELKTKKGKLGESQKKFKQTIESLGYEYHVVRDKSDFWYLLKNFAELPEKTYEEELRI